ncbi:unnamed protein product, partial [Lymnaea stagnalis]
AIKNVYDYDLVFYALFVKLGVILIPMSSSYIDEETFKQVFLKLNKWDIFLKKVLMHPVIHMKLTSGTPKHIKWGTFFSGLPLPEQACLKKSPALFKAKHN